MPPRPCVGCSRLFSTLSHSRCPACLAAYERTRMPRKRGIYDARWRAAAREAISQQPWCSVRGCRNTDLTGDHVKPASEGGTLNDGIVVLCRAHNSSRKGRPLAAFIAEAERALR